LTGPGNSSFTQGAKSFFRRWPTPQVWVNEPLDVRLAAVSQTTPFSMFSMVHWRLQPGWDWLVARKLSSL
jgi:hypothetical protein